MDSCPLLSATEHAQNAPNGKTAVTLAQIRILQEVTARFKAVQVDPAEFACLKAVALFKPGKSSTMVRSHSPTNFRRQIGIMKESKFIMNLVLVRRKTEYYFLLLGYMDVTGSTVHIGWYP